jgi:putative phage-type endonuclease
MITEQQRKDRMLGIGGSDMPIILGLSNYKTPYQLYLEKKGILSTSDEMSQLQYWGNRLEGIIRDEFSDRNNVLIHTPDDTIIHPFYDFMRANIDGYIPDWDAVLEVKCSSQFMSHEWGEVGSDHIPMAYLVQVAHYCSVLNAPFAYIAVLIGGHDYRQYKYTRDFELEKTVIEAGHAFWDAIQNETAPPATNQMDLRMMYPRHASGKSIAISDEIYNHILNLNDSKAKIKELQDIEEESRFTIMSYMQECECLTNESGIPLVTWKTNKRGSRTFLLKGEK